MEKFTIITRNIRYVQDKKRPGETINVLVVGDNKVVYRPRIIARGTVYERGTDKKIFAGDWESQYTGEEEVGLYQVEIDPENWKVYSFRNQFPGFAFDQEDTLESLEKVAQEQKETYESKGWFFQKRGQQKIDGTCYYPADMNHYLWRGWRPQEA